MGAAQLAFTLVMYTIGACLIAGALLPVILIIHTVWSMTLSTSFVFQAVVIALALGFGFFVFGFTLVLETVLLRFLLNLKLEEGEYNFFSVAGAKWAFVNAVMLIVNLLFMDFMRLTPFLPAYYRMMGAKIGRGVQINSKGIADVSLIEIGDGSVIGGDAVVIGHLAEHGKLKLKKTVIGKKVTIGLGAVIMPGCSIGDGSLIAARSVLSKNTTVAEKSLYAGTPAKLIKTL